MIERAALRGTLQRNGPGLFERGAMRKHAQYQQHPVAELGAGRRARVRQA